ncbi:MAG: NUDIX hydrolase [Planctomycetaceae bacterium]
MARTVRDRSKKVIGAGKYLRLVSKNGWEFVERINATGVVAVVAITDANEIILTEQFRGAVGKRVIDLPAGLAGDVKGSESEDLAVAARRELIEETGFDARRFELLAHSPSSPGLTTEIVTFFRAKQVRRVQDGGGGDGEEIETHLVKLDKAAAWFRRQSRLGKLVDCKAHAGLHFASRNPKRRKK